MRFDVLAGSGPIIPTKTYAVDGDLGDAGDVTVTVTDANGTVVSTGAALKTGAGAATVYSTTIDAANLVDPTWLRVSWVRDDGDGKLTPDTTIQVNGDVLFTENQARAAKIVGGQTPLADAVAYPDSFIAAARVAIGDLFEDRTGRSWVPRYVRVEARGGNSPSLWLPAGRPRTSTGEPVGGPGWALDVTRILSATVDGVTVDPADVQIDGQYLWLTTGGYWPAATSTNRFPVVVEYVYGVDPTPNRVTNLAVTELLHLLPTAVSQWVQSMQTDVGSFTFEPTYPRDVSMWFRENHIGWGVA